MVLSTSMASDLSGTKPNIIVIMTDDNGYADLGYYGHPYLQTPNLDKLATQGTRFEDFHVSSSCAPTRAAFMSGVHPFKVGVTHTIFHREKMNLANKTIAEVLTEAGYATGIFGKWHLGDSDPYQPHNRGFAESLIHGSGILGSGIRSNSSYSDIILRHNGKFVQTKGYCTDVFFSHSLNWIREQQVAKKPFFACIFPNAPHGPGPALKEDFDKYKDIITDPKHQGKEDFFGMIDNIDQNIGKLMNKLNEWDLSKDTILIYMTDNGSVASSIYNAGMKGGKTSINEGGSRVPFFIRFPDKIAANQEIHTLARHYDLFPTFADLAGADISDLNLDGKSLLPLINNPETQWEERTIFLHKGRWGNVDSKHEKHTRNPGADNNKFRTFAVRNETWRLTVSQSLERGAEIFNINDDAGETNDLSLEFPDIKEKLLASYSAWWDECRPLMINEDADITKASPSWKKYINEQGEVPLLEIPTP